MLKGSLAPARLKRCKSIRSVLRGERLQRGNGGNPALQRRIIRSFLSIFNCADRTICRRIRSRVSRFSRSRRTGKAWIDRLRLVYK